MLPVPSLANHDRGGGSLHHISGRQDTQDPRSVATANSEVSSGSIHSGSSANSSAHGGGNGSSANGGANVSSVHGGVPARKPRRAPPSRPTKPPSAPPGSRLTPPRTQPPSPSPLDSLASSVGNLTHTYISNGASDEGPSDRRTVSNTPYSSHVERGGGSGSGSGTGSHRAFEPIRLSSRGSTPKKSRKKSAPPASRCEDSPNPAEPFVENSYNTRSFYDSSRFS